MSRIGLIWAQTPAGVIGADGCIPWHVPEDSAHFRTTTAGARVVMGRKTWDSLPPRFRPLPGRENIVVTRDLEWAADGAHRAASLEAALTGTDNDIWVMGGSEIYRAAVPFADVIEVTEIDLDVPGDTYAPTITEDFTAAVGEWTTSSASGTRYRFVRYDRSAAA